MFPRFCGTIDRYSEITVKSLYISTCLDLSSQGSFFLTRFFLCPLANDILTWNFPGVSRGSDSSTVYLFTKAVGTVNHGSVLQVRLTTVGENSALSQIVGLVEQAQSQRAPVQE